ncbi:MAG: hypothetical protein KFB93_06130 [Simkaniaceae bacterium]|nr:MAG: hypothetical protein KFB93_06130 [Simkaniaceae bacterium]
MKKLLFLILMITGSLCASIWEPPLDLSNNTPGNGNGVIVVDTQGNAAVIWQDANTSAIFTSYRYFDGGWEGPTVLDTTGEPDPYICVDEAGNLRAVWEFGSTIRTATKAFGAGWTPFVQIYTRKATYDNLRVACVQNNGYSVVSWYEDSGVSKNVVALTYDGATWTNTFLNNTATHTVDSSSKPIPRILPNGTTHIAFIATDVGTGNADIYTSMGSAATGTWSTIAARGFTKPGTFDFAQSATGNGGIACLDSTNAVIAAYYIGGAWGPVGTVTSTVTKEVKIGIDQNNIATMAYGTSSGEIQKASTNVTAISYQFATISPGTVGFHSPRLSVSENGGMVTSYLGGGGEVYGQTGANGVFETTPATLNALAKVESVAMSNNGTAYALWKDTVTTGFMEASRTYNPTDYFIRSLGKKRLILQKGLYP